MSTRWSILYKRKGCFDSIWLPQFPTSCTSLNTGVYLIYGMDYGMDWWNGLMEWNIS